MAELGSAPEDEEPWAPRDSSEYWAFVYGHWAEECDCFGCPDAEWV